MLPCCGKNSEEYSRKIAGQDHEVDIDFPWQSATFDNPVLVQNVWSIIWTHLKIRNVPPAPGWGQGQLPYKKDRSACCTFFLGFKKVVLILRVLSLIT